MPMTLPGTLRLPIVALAVCAGLVMASAADHRDYQVIVHPDNPVAQVDRQFLRDAYLRKAADWNGGQIIRPIDLATRFAVREQFVQDVLKKSPSQLKNYWNQQIFSGKGVPPPEADSTAAVVSYVLANLGAIGYLPADANPGGTKVVKVN
jgi:ABC-type phosphate transport system substrate-binding protein